MTTTPDVLAAVRRAAIPLSSCTGDAEVIMGTDGNVEEALLGFERVPTWMWRNRGVVDLVTSSREWNVTRPASARAGVFEHLGTIDPDAALRARYRYSCLDHFDEDIQACRYATSSGTSRGCEDEVVEPLVELRRRAAEESEERVDIGRGNVTDR